MIGISISLCLGARAAGGGAAKNRYMIAANRFHMAVDWGTGASGFATGGGMTGINGGTGAQRFRYHFRRWKFSTTWAAKGGRFLFANAALGVVGVLNGLYDVSIQRVEIRTTDNVVVDVIRFGGSGAYSLAAGGRIWSDACADMAADTTYYLDIYWTGADLAAWPAMAQAYLAGETGSNSLTTNLALGNPITTPGAISNAFGGVFGPTMFVGRGCPSDEPVALLTGDSILDGTHVSAYFALARGDYGHIQQALGDAAGGRINYCSLARYSSSMVTLYQDNTSGYGGKNVVDWIADACAELQAEPVFNVWVNQHGRNNLSINQSLAGQREQLRLCAAKMWARYPGVPLVQTTTCPSTTVPAYGAAVPGIVQTGNGPANSAGGTIQLWNDWIVRGGGGNNPGDSRPLPTCIGIDTAAVCRDPADYGLWRTEAFSATLLDAVTALGTRTIRLSAAPSVGDTLVYEVGVANIDSGSRLGVVSTVAPHASGGYAVTLVGGARNSMADGTANNGYGAPTKAHAAGVTVQALSAAETGGSSTTTLYHPAHKYQMAMRDVVIASKAAIRAAVAV